MAWCNDEASAPKSSSCHIAGVAGLRIDDFRCADAAWSCDMIPSCGSTSATATSCIIAEVSDFCYPLHCLLHVSGSRRDAMAALTGTTTRDEEAGVVDKNQMM